MNNKISASHNPTFNYNKTRKQNGVAPGQRNLATSHPGESLVNTPVGEEFVGKLPTLAEKSFPSGKDKSFVVGVSAPESPGRKTSTLEQSPLGVERSGERIETSVNGAANFAPSVSFDPSL